MANYILLYGTPELLSFFASTHTATSRIRMTNPMGTAMAIARSRRLILCGGMAVVPFVDAEVVSVTGEVWVPVTGGVWVPFAVLIGLPVVVDSGTVVLTF